jgi:hypothetical protein
MPLSAFAANRTVRNVTAYGTDVRLLYRRGPDRNNTAGGRITMQPESAFDVPSPVLLNAWKHHAGALRRRIADAARAGPGALAELAPRLLVIGTELMDLYTGLLAPAEVAAGVIAQLSAEGRLEPSTYREWLEGNRGYRVLALPADGSAWVLRFGEEGGRYVHVHPSRWTPHTRRVRANVLKTAVMALAYAGAHGGDPLDVALINRARRDYLGLAPLPRLADEGGLGAVIAALRERAP